MKTYIVPGTKDWFVIVKGPLVEANRALGRFGIHRPYRNVWFSPSHYGAIHATVSAGEDQLQAWFNATHDRGPRCLLWYQSQ